MNVGVAGLLLNAPTTPSGFPRGDFNLIAPGLMVFAIMLLIGYAATTLSRETEQGTLHRFQLAQASWMGYLGGVTLAHLLLASFAFGMMLLGAHVMGFENNGSYLHAYVIILITAVSALGVGMVIAAVSKRREEAANLSMLAALPLGFLSGAFFEVPGVEIKGFDIYELLPTTHAITALRAILNDGQTLSDVSGHMLALSGAAALYVAFGATLYWWRRMRRPATGSASAA